MSIDDLKKRATASELTLIEAIEAAVHINAVKSVKVALFEFIVKNPPPSRGDPRYGDRDSELREWFNRLEKHLNPDAS